MGYFPPTILTLTIPELSEGRSGIVLVPLPDTPVVFGGSLAGLGRAGMNFPVCGCLAVIAKIPDALRLAGLALVQARHAFC